MCDRRWGRPEKVGTAGTAAGRLGHRLVCGLGRGRMCVYAHAHAHLHVHVHACVNACIWCGCGCGCACGCLVVGVRVGLGVGVRYFGSALVLGAVCCPLPGVCVVFLYMNDGVRLSKI